MLLSALNPAGFVCFLYSPSFSTSDVIPRCFSADWQVMECDLSLLGRAHLCVIPAPLGETAHSRSLPTCQTSLVPPHPSPPPRARTDGTRVGHVTQKSKPTGGRGIAWSTLDQNSGHWGALGSSPKDALNESQGREIGGHQGTRGCFLGAAGQEGQCRGSKERRSLREPSIGPCAAFRSGPVLSL